VLGIQFIYALRRSPITAATAVWYLAELPSPDHYLVGATLPGAPVISLGRTHDLAWPVTYGTADISDYFVEQVEIEKYCHGVVEPMTLPLASYRSDRISQLITQKTKLTVADMQ